MYYKTAIGAAEAARELTEALGYQVCENDWTTQIVHGGIHNRLRPSVGMNHSYSIALLKNDKPQRKCLQISLYGMPSGKFELVNYVN